MTINNENFNAFLRDKEQRQYIGQSGDKRCFILKLPYDDDCDFIHVIRTYRSRYNPDGKPELQDESKLGGIYVYSLDLLFNIEYELREFLAGNSLAETPPDKGLTVQEYYKQLCSDISTEVIRRIETGQFDQAGAAKLVADDDRDIEYYKEYREQEYAERDFLDGRVYDKPELHIHYDTRREYDTDAVLEYLRNPDGIVNARVADVKTVTVTFERDEQTVTAKADAGRLGYCDTVSDWELQASDRAAYNAVFGYKNGGDARMDEITLITHGRKELYCKPEFDGVLSVLFTGSGRV